MFSFSFSFSSHVYFFFFLALGLYLVVVATYPELCTQHDKPKSPAVYILPADFIFQFILSIDIGFPSSQMAAVDPGRVPDVAAQSTRQDRGKGAPIALPRPVGGADLGSRNFGAEARRAREEVRKPMLNRTGSGN